MIRKLLWTALIGAVLLSAGCIDAEKIHVRIEMAPDLTGRITLEFLGIHSGANTPEEQKVEMKDFYETYPSDGAEIAQEWSLKNARTELSNKTDLRCDGRIAGEIDDLIKSLSPLAEPGAEFELKRDATRFYFTSRGGYDETDDAITLYIAYAGRIVEHNAHKYDERANQMEWNLGKLTDAGIHFVLELQ